jgi:hypothetical protein
MNKPARDLHHPVWDVYDQFRTARLNAKYFSCRVASLKTLNFWIEVVLAATATGSALAGLAFWSTEFGKPVWQGLLVISAIIALVKPPLKLTDRIQLLQEWAADFKGVEYELKKIEIGIRQQGDFTSALKNRFFTTMDRYAELARKAEAESRIDNRLKRRCQDEVARELPAEKFFVPERG